MFFTAWYLCSTNKISLAEAMMILETVDTLESQETRVELKVKASENAQEMDALVGAALVPFFTETLINSGKRMKEWEELKIEEQKAEEQNEDDLSKSEMEDDRQILMMQYHQNLENTILHFLGDKAKPSTRNLIAQLHEADFNSIIDYIRSVKVEPNLQSEDFIPYQEADLFVVESFILALLVTVGETVPESIEEFVTGEKELELVSMAANGQLGQSCWNLAMRLRFIEKGMNRNIFSRFPKRWLERPDLVEIAVPYIFKGDANDVVEMILEESQELKVFSRLWDQKYSRIPNDIPTFWLRNEAPNWERRLYSVIIWQNILWRNAFSRNMYQTTSWLQRKWIVPTYRRFKAGETANNYDYLNRDQKQLIPKKIKLEGKTEEEQKLVSNIYICTPWQRRTEDTADYSAGKYNDSGNAEDLFHAFRDFYRNEYALRTFCATSLLKRIIRYAKRRINVNYISLILNFADAFSCFGAQNTFRQMSGDRSNRIYMLAWTAPIRIIGFYANNVINEIGSGRINNLVPLEIINKVKNRSPLFGNESKASRIKNKQLKLVYRFSGLFCASKWAYYSLMESSVSSGKEESPWLGKNAKKLVNYLIETRSLGDGYSLPEEGYSIIFALSELEEGYSLKSEESIFNEDQPSPWNCSAERYAVMRNPSIGNWRHVSNEFEMNTAENSCFLAATARLCAALESDDAELTADWYSDWLELIKNLQIRSQISNLEKLFLLRLFSVKPINEENKNITAYVMEIILQYYAAESNRSYMYYFNVLAKHLIQLKDEISDDAIVNLRAVYAIQLYKRCLETEKDEELYERWNALYIYYLYGIREDLYSSYGISARKDILDCWDSELTQQDHVRTRIKEVQKWDPVQELYWAAKPEGLMTIGRSLDLSTRFDDNEAVTNQYTSDVTVNNSFRVGIVANVKKIEQNRQYTIYTGNDNVLMYTQRGGYHRKNYYIGDVLGVRKNSRGLIDKIKKLGGVIGDSSFVKASNVDIKADEIFLTVLGEEKYYILEKAEEMFSLWSGDTVRFLENTNTRLKQNVPVYYGEYAEGKYGWIPKAKSYAELMLRHLMRDGRDDNHVCLTYIRAEGESKLLFSAGQGDNYLLEKSCFKEDTWEELQRRLFDGEERRGMRIWLVLSEENGYPKLTLCEDGFDDVNIRWASMFDTQRPLRASFKPDDKMWVINNEMPEIKRVKHIQVSIRRVERPLNTRDSIIVETEEDGWGLQEMRTATVKVMLVQTRTLSTHMNYDEFCKLKNLSPGMIFQFGYVSSKSPRNGYRMANLRNNLLVYCAEESISFRTDWTLDGFVKGRMCIVDNVKETAPQDDIPDDLVGDWPECLKDQDCDISGVLAEFAVNVQSHSEDLNLKVYLDINGTMRSAIVPLHAFWPRPNNLGERIDAKKTERGWIFLVTKREFVNVRALWKIADHRNEENPTVVGEPLGLVNLKRGVSCMMMQDVNEPVIHAYDSNLDYAHEFNTKCGIPQGKGKVQVLRTRFSSRRYFPWAFRKDIVEVREGKALFIGDANQGAFSEGKSGWTVHAELYEVTVGLDVNYYDLRRVFASTGYSKKELGQDAGKKEEMIRLYHDWYEIGDRHVYAGASSFETATYVRLHDLYVPADTIKNINDVEFSNIVDLELDHDPIVRGRKYRTDDIRVVLKIKDNKWVASVKDVLPWHLDNALCNYFGIRSGMSIKKIFYYAGRDEQFNMIFEWGIGNYFKARSEDITDMDGGTFGYELFFGDSVRAMKFIADPDGEFGWRVRIRQEDIVHEVEGLVWEDTEENIVQLLKVKKDEKTEKVRISAVSVFSRRINLNTGYDGWQFRDIRNASLSQQSQEKLRDEIPDGQEMIVFANLNMLVSGRDKRDIVFDYISLDPADGQIPLLEHKVLCLKAYKIETTAGKNERRISNDYKISFYLPGELPEDTDSPRFVMSVRRRLFSIDESRLRLDYSKDPDKYLGSNMLVSLGQLKDSEKRLDFDTYKNGKVYKWEGSVIWTPRRSKESLKMWLAGIPSCIVALDSSAVDVSSTKREKPEIVQKVSAEIEPGIICDISEECEGRYFQKGTLARLSLENEKIVVRTILAGDKQYFSGTVRPAELLIMDGVLKRYGKEDIGAEDGKENGLGAHFTIAGFPQLLIQNVQLFESMIRRPLPRIATVSINRNWIEASENTDFYAGYLQTKERKPFITLIERESRTLMSEWNKMSYFDGTVSEIIDTVIQAKWHYHDRLSGRYDDVKRRVLPVVLPNGEDYRKIVHFFTDDLRLRYKRDELSTYGMSSREIIEHGLPRQYDWYAVAGGELNNLWVELSPGKVVDISANYIMAGRNRCNLSELIMSSFGEGDKVRLMENNTNTGGQFGIQMMDFSFGGRGMLKGNKAILPITEILDDGLVLGGGIFKFTYPMVAEEIQNYYKNQTLVLDEGNNLLAESKMEDLTQNAIVYVTLDQHNKMIIPGMEDIEVGLAYESYWTNAEWMYRAIYKNRESVFEMFEEYIPLRIAKINTSARKIWVAYQQSEIEVQEGQSLAVNCIALFPKYYNDERVIVRSGNYLFLVKSDTLIRGAERELLQKIVKSLAADRTAFFITRTSNGWINGLGSANNMDSINIKLICEVVGGDGFIARNLKDLSLKFLPIEKACRVKIRNSGIVWKALSKRPERLALLQNNDYISLIDEYKSVESYHNILYLNSIRNKENEKRSIAKRKIRIIPIVMLSNEDGRYNYLAEIYPKGDVVLFCSEYEIEISEDVEPIAVELVEWQKQNVVAVPEGEKRIRIHLSQWFIESMRENYRYYGDMSFRLGEFDPESIIMTMHSRFQGYKTIVRKTLNDDKDPNKLRMALLRDDIKLNERLIYCYIRMKFGEIRGDLLKQSIFTMVKWLEGPGRCLSMGLRNVNMLNTKLDMIPVGAAVLILDLYEIEDNEVLKLLSVHLARMLGYAAGLCVNEEVLLNEWLKKRHDSVQWNMLQQLSLGGERIVNYEKNSYPGADSNFDGLLNPTQYNAILEKASSILRLNLKESSIESTVRALLLSVSECRDYHALFRFLNSNPNEYDTVRLAPFGRLLTPEKGRNYAFSKLPDDVRKMLDYTVRFKTDSPIELHLDTEIPITDEERSYWSDMCDNSISVLNNYLYRIRNRYRNS